MLDVVLLSIDYDWNANNTLASRTETNNVTQESAVATFTYDRRHRLIQETRVVGLNTVYDIEYTYDPLGNRLSKTDSVAQTKTDYYYDSDPANREPGFPTNNNRLMWYSEQVQVGQQWVETRKVRYVYYQTGDVSNIVIKDTYVGQGQTPAEYDWCYDLALYYTTGGRLWRALWDKWEVDEYGDEIPGTYTQIRAREFYYDAPTERYLSREVTPDGSSQYWVPTGTWEWTDYYNGRPYGDFTLDPAADPDDLDEEMRYLPGIGLHAQQDASTGATQFHHADLADSAFLTTDETGSAGASVSYTAFGEPIGNTAAMGTRYQYGGGWGYESGLLTLEGVSGKPSITLLHVGARWYDPALGRFIQRDPLGILAGLNVYLYCQGNPLSLVDPSGEWAGAIVGGVIGGFWGALSAIGSGGNGLVGGIGGVIAGAAGGFVSGALSTITSPGWAGAAGGFVSGAILGAIEAYSGGYGWRRTLATIGANAGLGALAGGVFSGMFGETTTIAGQRAVEWSAGAGGTVGCLLVFGFNRLYDGATGLGFWGRYYNSRVQGLCLVNQGGG